MLACFNIFASLIIDVFLAQYDSHEDEDAVSKEIGSLQTAQVSGAECGIWRGVLEVVRRMGSVV